MIQKIGEITELNLQEITYLKECLNIQYQRNRFQVQPVSTKQLRDIVSFVQQKIWNSENATSVIETLGKDESGMKLYYWGESEPTVIDSFLSRIGVFGYKIILTDPFSVLVNTNPNYPDAPLNNPDLYLKYIMEYALFLIYLEDWVRKGYIYLVPYIHVWDYRAWKDLSEINEHFFSLPSVSSSEEFKTMFNYGLFQGACRCAGELMRLTQENATIEYIQEVSNHLDPQQSLKLLNYLRTMPKEQRELSAVRFAAQQYGTDEITQQEYLDKLQKRRIFDIENYFDISKWKGGMLIDYRMSIPHAIYIADKLNCIPTTDQRINLLNYELWDKHIGIPKEISPKIESVRSKIDLPFEFLNDVPLDFVAELREKNKDLRLRNFLDEYWQNIRQAKSEAEYVSALNDFQEKVSLEFQQAKEDWQAVKDHAFRKFTAGGIGGLGTIISGILQNQAWYLGTVGIGAWLYKEFADYKKEKYQLSKNPLFIFLNIERKFGGRH